MGGCGGSGCGGGGCGSCGGCGGGVTGIDEGGAGGGVMADLGVNSCPVRVRSRVDFVLPSTRRTSAIRLRVRSSVDLVRR